MHMRNSFIQHNNVRRPGESHRGAGRKKICCCTVLPHVLAFHLSLPCGTGSRNSACPQVVTLWLIPVVIPFLQVISRIAKGDKLVSFRFTVSPFRSSS